MKNERDKLLLMSDNLAVWLNAEIQQRGWSLRQVARRAGISHTTIVKLANGTGTPEVKTCQALARALAVPVDEILRLAGILPTSQPPLRESRIIYEANSEDRIIQLWRALSPEDRDLVHAIMERLAKPIQSRIIGEPPCDDSSAA